MDRLHSELNQLRAQMRYFKYYAIFSSLFITGLLFSSFRENEIAQVLKAERIEIVEKDGKVKLSLFNKENLPPAIIDGKKLPRQGGNESGLMFYNEEGEECGGLIYSGSGRKGEMGNGASLTFDKYKQDQVVQLFNDQTNADKKRGLIISDRPDFSLVRTIAILDSIRQTVSEKSKQDEALAQLEKQGKFGRTRLFVGQKQKETGVFLYDKAGNKRIQMIVNENDKPEIIFYNDKGEAMKNLSY